MSEDINIIVEPPAPINITVAPPAQPSIVVSVPSFDITVAGLGVVGPQGPQGPQGPAGSGGGGGDPTGTLLDPILLDPVKWLWDFRDAAQPGVDVGTYDGTGVGVLTATINGAFPTAQETYALLDGVPVGSTANVAIGIQVGDRIFYNDQWSNGHQGVYTVTDLGDGSSPWVLTRADDMPIADLLLAFRVEVEDADIVIRTAAIETDPEFISPAIEVGQGAQALSGNSVALSFATALGAGARAAAAGTFAVGTDARTLAPNSTAIGAGARGVTTGATVIGSNTGGAIIRDHLGFVTDVIDFDTGATFDTYLEGDTTFTTSNVTAGRTVTVRIFPGDGLPHALAFPAWTWLTAVPTSIDGDAVGLLTLTCFGSADSDVLASYLVTP